MFGSPLWHNISTTQWDIFNFAQDDFGDFFAFTPRRQFEQLSFALPYPLTYPFKTLSTYVWFTTYSRYYTQHSTAIVMRTSAFYHGVKCTIVEYYIVCKHMRSVQTLTLIDLEMFIQTYVKSFVEISSWVSQFIDFTCV